MASDAPIRPRRSVLYVPGANARALGKCRNLPADGLILDLEDAVLPGSKATARAAVLAALAEGGFGQREVVVRVNGPDTAWGADDLAACARAGAAAILLPKVESAAAVRDAVAALERHGAPGHLALWVMAETPRGILAIEEITAASPRLAVVVMGTADLARALRLEPGPDRAGLLPALGRCLLAARARGLDILDGVYPDLADSQGFAASCRQGKALGFDGKTLIHPGQIPAANEVFGVSAAEAAGAAELIAAWESAAASGQGIAVLRGRMVEQLHAEEARRVLALHGAIARIGSAGAPADPGAAGTRNRG